MSKRHEDAKDLVRGELHGHGILYNKLTARIVSFSDLARGDAVFVKVHGAEPAARLQLVKQALKGTGVLLDPVN